MSRQVQSLIDQLIAVAKARGMSQAELAQRAGMSAVGLSKAKRRGDIRAATLGRMAEVLDLELSLIPRRSDEKVREAIRAGRFFRTRRQDDEGGD